MAPFVLLVTVAVAVVAMLSFFGARRAADGLALQLRAEVTERVVGKVSEFLSEPRRLLAVAAGATVAIDAPAAVALAWPERLADHLRDFEAISILGMGTEEGEYRDAERREGGEIVLQRSGPSTGFQLVTAEPGGRVLARSPGYDARARPWYVAAASSGAARWSEVYRSYANPSLQVALSVPTRDRAGKLLGVATAAIRLGRMDAFLRSVKIGRTGMALVVDADGHVVSMPDGEASWGDAGGGPGSTQPLLQAAESHSPVVRGLAAHVARMKGGFAGIAAPNHFDLEIDGARWLASVTPLPPEIGLDWRIAVALPESDFMQPIRGAARAAAGLALLATAAAALLGTLLVRWVTRPISQIHAAALALASGEAPGPLPVHRGDEVGGLARSFQHMARQLRDRQQALADSERSYREVFEGTRDAIFVHDAATGAILDANRRAEQMYGRTREEFVRTGVTAISRGDPPWSTEDAARWIRRAVEEGPQVFEWRARRQSGEAFWAEVALSPIAIAGEGRVLATVRDVSARKQAEEGLRRLAAAVEQTPASIVITDERGDIQYVNPAFERVTGYARSEVLAQNPRLLKSGEHPEEVYRQLWATVKDGRVWQGRLVNRKKSGALFTEDVTIAPVKDETGAVTNFVAVKRDVTQELSLQQQLAASQKLESIGRLAGGIAHDFNNLLTVILSCSASLRADLDEGRPAGREEVEEIHGAGERARDLTRQLLAFARRQAIAPVPLDLNVALRGSERLLRRILGEDVELTTALQPDLWLVRCDPGQLEQVVLNLAVNARDAMPDGGRLAIETSHLDLTASEAVTHPGLNVGQYVRLVVRDSGEGMTAEVRDRLFEPFFTTKAPGKGTGLGLATVYGIVTQSSGLIRVESEPGSGSAFEILLPRSLEAPRAAAAPDLPPSCSGFETILLVEDDLAVRDVAARLLRERGYRVLVAADGPEALTASAREPGFVQLLLTDVVLPGLGGRQLADELCRRRPGLRVLLMSGYMGGADALAGIGDGAAFLQKPFSAPTLAAKVRQVLDADGARVADA